MWLSTWNFYQSPVLWLLLPLGRVEIRTKIFEKLKHWKLRTLDNTIHFICEVGFMVYIEIFFLPLLGNNINSDNYNIIVTIYFSSTCVPDPPLYAEPRWPTIHISHIYLPLICSLPNPAIINNSSMLNNKYVLSHLIFTLNLWNNIFTTFSTLEIKKLRHQGLSHFLASNK